VLVTTDSSAKASGSDSLHLVAYVQL